MTKPTFYITTPIYYVNDKPHLGHAYTTTACDVLARFKRLDGFDVMFLTGTDEHGQKVAQAAEAAEMDPQRFTDQVSQNFRDLSPLLNFSNDDFIRTTEERHKIACQTLWKKLEDAGEIYLDTYSGWYAVRDEAYYGEDELHEVDGVRYAPSGAECEWVEEESYFFRLSKWAEPLLQFYKQNPSNLENSHFRVTIEEGQSIMRDLQGKVSGLSLPHYMLDLPDGYGKIPVGYSHIEAGQDGVYFIKDPKGHVHQYPPKHKSVNQ